MKNLKMYEGCLIVVDMVNGFVREGVLHDPKIADIIPAETKLCLYNFCFNIKRLNTT